MDLTIEEVIEAAKSRLAEEAWANVVLSAQVKKLQEAGNAED